ncbi:MAG: CBS domain-containing protein [Planctomycetota bacterium]
MLYWMTPDPIVAEPTMTLLEVRSLMVQHGIRRLPVVEGDDLCGMIGRSDLYRWCRPDILYGDIDTATETSLGRIRVSDAMTHEPLTCSAYDHIETLAARMAREKKGAYPVLNRGHLVGVISESDVMRAVVELTHRGEPGRRITVSLAPGEEGVLYRIVDLCRRSQLELHAVLTHTVLDESALLVTVRVEGDDVETFVKALWDANYKVLEVS